MLQNGSAWNKTTALNRRPAAEQAHRLARKMCLSENQFQELLLRNSQMLYRDPLGTFDFIRPFLDSSP